MNSIDWNISIPPLRDQETMDLIRLWRTEWPHGDFDWISSLSGDCAATLRLSVVTGRAPDHLAATATAVGCETGGEIALISSVMTAACDRGRGLGAEATELAVAEAGRRGARVVFLGTNAWPKNVYQKIGFSKLNGIVMRRQIGPGDAPEDEIFAPGQSACIREAEWGDAPSFVGFVIQPHNTFLLSFRQSLVSSKFAPLKRCVSNFAPLYEDCLSSGGKLFVLASESQSRVFGFSACIPMKGVLGEIAWIEAAAHDAYAEQIDSLIDRALEQARTSGAVSALFANHPEDLAVRNACLRHGFAPTAEIPTPASPSGKLDLLQKLL
jgi:GNAT superfamily N-acetyltransferase